MFGQGWPFAIMIAVWALLFWSSQSQGVRSPFKRRLDQLLVLLLPQAETNGRGITASLRRNTIRAFGRPGTLDGLRGSARRWRAQLRAVHAQGYQVACETIHPPAKIARAGELVQEIVEALKAERASGGAKVPATEDPVVVLAYGLGAWPPGADLTSLEQLLEELGVSHGDLRSRFESLIRTVTTGYQNPEFRELAGASFVLGASARIVEAADAPGRSVPPPRWLAALTTHRR